MNYSEKYGVKKAKSTSDDSILYGKTSDLQMKLILFAGFGSIPLIFAFFLWLSKVVG